MKKYTLTDEVNVIALHRIVALRDIPRHNVKKGDLGGFIESEENLSQEGDAWVSGNALVSEGAKVYGDACIFGNAQVCGNAIVCDNSWVSGNAMIYNDAEVYGVAEICGEAVISRKSDYITFQIWWDSNNSATWTRSNNMWTVGNFYGTAEELLSKAEKESKVSFIEYKRLVDYVESILKDENSTKKKQIHRDSKGRFCKCE